MHSLVGVFFVVIVTITKCLRQDNLTKKSSLSIGAYGCGVVRSRGAISGGILEYHMTRNRQHVFLPLCGLL